MNTYLCIARMTAELPRYILAYALNREEADAHMRALCPNAKSYETLAIESELFPDTMAKLDDEGYMGFVKIEPKKKYVEWKLRVLVEGDDARAARYLVENALLDLNCAVRPDEFTQLELAHAGDWK